MYHNFAVTHRTGEFYIAFSRDKIYLWNLYIKYVYRIYKNINNTNIFLLFVFIQIVWYLREEICYLIFNK